MSKLLSAFVAAGFATLAATSAHATIVNDCNSCATPIAGQFAVSIWSAVPPSNQLSSSEPALPSNPIVKSANLVGTGTYSGEINFNSPGATATVSSFFRSGTGSYSGSGGSTVLNAPGYSNTRVTLIEFSFTVAKGMTNVVISHDDGVSLFNANNSSVDLLSTSYAQPNNTSDTSAISLAAGTYNLWYSNIDGGAAVLCFDPQNAVTATLPTATPEPASLALLGFGLATVGFVRRRAA